MSSVILFGGGDGGGLIITPNGIRPIPPFDPGILFNIKATAHLVNAISATRDQRVRGKMIKLATNLSNLAVEQVEQVVGPLEASHSLIYQDEDGGFTCGSTGKPPIPFPWPPRQLPTIADLIGAGVVEADLVQFVRAAHERKVELMDIFEKPAELAKKLGVTLSEKSVKDLESLAPSKLKNIKDETDRQIVGFMHKVVEDGHYLDTWFTKPYEVSQELKYKLNDAALERIVAGGAAVTSSGWGPGPRADFGVSVVIVSIADAIIIAIVGLSSRPVEEIVRDRSAIAKI